MTGGEAPSAASLPRWLPWVFLPLLVLPFHPLWVDFEQVRRGLLLVLAGGALLLLPRLRPAAGERAGFWFLGLLAVSAVVNLAGQAIAADAQHPVSFQPWEAIYRLAHWLALGVVLRLGAAMPQGFGTTFAGTLLVTSLYGLLQRLGLAELAGYGVAREPVSVFGNLNVASEWTAVAAAATAVLVVRQRWLAGAALAAAGAYLVVDGSRSGLIALPIGLLLLWLLRRRIGGWLPLALAAGGALCGLLLEVTLPAAAPTDVVATRAERSRAAATLKIRLEIAKGSTHLFGESPVFGHGPGQFQVEYPRVRSQQEIEASSLGRRFATEVRTAHDDWLELLVDGGLPALILFAWLLFALQRGTSDRARLVPLFVLLLLMLARSPLWNAPAVAAALLLAGRPALQVPAARPWRRWTRWLLALVLLALGALPLLGNTLAIPYQRARALGEQPPVEALTQALTCMPFEPRWLQLLAQEQMLAGDLAAAATTAERALRLRPYDPQLYVLLGEVLARGNRPVEAEQVARHALALDPPNPELRVLLSTVLAQRGDADDAVQAVVEHPHPMLRAQLGEHFRDLAQMCDRRGDQPGAARFRVEQHFVQAVDTVGDQTPAALAATSAHLQLLLPAMQEAGMLRSDPRGYLLSALHALDVGTTADAIRLGTQVHELGLSLPGWQRLLLGDKLQPLERFESWQPVLRR
jgi:tetratricopeptide (TPR) repeat protein